MFSEETLQIQSRGSVCHFKGNNRIEQLSRNVLYLISEYLQYMYVSHLASTSQQIRNKLDRYKEDGNCYDSYLEKRAILFYQQFFFQQFSQSDKFYQRMGSITSLSTVQSSNKSFLPLSRGASVYLDSVPTHISDLPKPRDVSKFESIKSLYFFDTQENHFASLE
jgi:hypothetical protein